MAVRPRVVTARDAGAVGGQAGRPSPREDPYVSKVVKYVPAEIVGAHVALMSLLDSDPNLPSWPDWASTGFLLVLTPVWIWITTREPGRPIAWFQGIASAVAFAVWAYAMDGRFTGIHHPIAGSVALIVVSLLIPLLEKLFVKPETTPPAAGSS